MDTAFSPRTYAMSREVLENLAQPTHLLVSGFLRRSATFGLYAEAMTELGIPGQYIPCEIPRVNGKPDLARLRELLDIFRVSTELETLMISDPYKSEIFPLLDGTERRARQTGSVNLVFKRHYSLIGDNLDGEAFLMGADAELKRDFRGGRMVFFGCGGVSSAVATTLAKTLRKVALLDIAPDRAVRLRERLVALAPKLEIDTWERISPLNLQEYDIFYNGTGLGKLSHEPESELLSPLLDGDLLPEGGLAIDANYTPWETAFLRSLAARGFKTLNGFSHMVSSTALHLAFISGRAISYPTVKRFADKLLVSG